MATSETIPTRPPTSAPSLAARHLSVVRLGVRSDRSIAGILDVSPSQITRWRRGQTPHPDHADQLAALALVVEMLTRSLHPDVIEGWLYGPNAHLADRSPVYMLGIHQLGAVVGAVETMKAGTFA
jgi:transcriptional regulator with XRE-family HTH domain